MGFSGPFPDVTIPDVSLHELLFKDLGPEDTSRIALIDPETHATTTYAELSDQIDRIAGALAARGIHPGDVVALHSPNSPEFVALFHGILRAGAIVTPVNILYTGPEIARQLIDSNTKLIITTSALLKTMTLGAGIAGRKMRRMIVIDGAGEFTSLREMLNENRPAPQVSIDPATHLAVLPYSSGTSGTPKGVMLTHRNLVANVVQAGPLLEIGPEDVIPAILPFFHIYGMTVLLNITLAARGRLIPIARFDLTQFLATVQENKCTYLFVAPPVALALARHPAVTGHDLSTVRTILSGAAPLGAALATELAERVDTRVVQGYGMSEMSPISHITPASLPNLSPGSVGVTVPNMICKIIDTTTGEEIEIPDTGMSTPGELLCKGPNVMLGYLANTTATAETLDADGFLHTGDIVTFDSHGAMYVVDRVKELIKYHGYQVAPAELEAILLTHPHVADAAVVGVLDDEGQETPKAFIVAAADSSADAAEIMAYLAERVAPHKKVRQLEFIEIIPKSSAGKILRKDLRARVVLSLAL